MPRMWASDYGCKGATVQGGGDYHADGHGFINANDRDVKALQAGGFQLAGGMPRLGKYWVCDDCAWDSAINHCCHCDSTSLRKVER